MMRAIEIVGGGGPETLRVCERPVPEIGPRDVLVQVAAASVNRPDVAQRKGFYPPPPGASDIPGLDIAGFVVATGRSVRRWRAGDRVCALVTGGGYAEFCSAPAVQCMPVPRGLSLVEAASLPEVFFTAWNNIIDLGRLSRGETLLVQGGTSGVGVAAIQMARALRDARVFATAGTAEKRSLCESLGAERALDYQRDDWADELRRLTGGRGVDLILDSQAGDYTQRELDCLAWGGRLVLIADHRGARAEIDLRRIIFQRLTLTGSTLRARPPAFKARIARRLETEIWPLLAGGRIRTLVQAEFPLERAADAQRVLDENRQIGKVVLIVDGRLAAS